MKCLVLGGLSFLMMCMANMSAAQAQTTRANLPGITSSYVGHIGPVNLAQQAYRGRFKKYGIPSYQLFISEYEGGRFRTRDVVQAAVKARMAPPSVLTDQGYINAVRAEIRNLVVNE